MRILKVMTLSILVVALSSVTRLARGQPSLDWYLIDGVGGVPANGEIAMVGTISSDDAAFMANDTVSLHSVFQPWPSFFYHPPAQPSLQVAFVTNHVILSWPAQFTSYQLECASMLEVQATNWTTVAQSPVTVNNEMHIALPASGPFRFYRLRREQ